MYMETTPSIVLVTVSAVGMATLGLAALTSLITKLWSLRMGGNRGSTPEERVLDQSEYDKFGPNPYEDEFSSVAISTAN